MIYVTVVDRRNGSALHTTLSRIQEDYPKDVLNTLMQDGSVSLPKEVDIYLDNCYTFVEALEQQRYLDEMSRL